MEIQDLGEIVVIGCKWATVSQL